MGIFAETPLQVPTVLVRSKDSLHRYTGEQHLRCAEWVMFPLQKPLVILGSDNKFLRAE